MEHELTLKEIKKEWHGSLKAYMIGFTTSLLLTIASFLLVILKPISGSSLVYTLAGLALVQAVLQVRYFLHIGEEAHPRWQAWSFYFMIMVLLIIVLGSLWIMYDLDMRVMSGMTGEMTHD